MKKLCFYSPGPTSGPEIGKTLPSLLKSNSRGILQPAWLTTCLPSDPKVSNRVPKGYPERPQGTPKDPKRLPKGTPKNTPRPSQDQKQIDTLSKLGFVHRRNVFKPPKPKADYPYYTFGT